MFKSFLYPQGRVNKYYCKYIGWSFLSNMIVSLESVLSTHSMLSVVGKQNAEIAISLNYIGKDIFGQIGGLWYMNQMGRKADKDTKKFLKYSLTCEQTSLFVECATPLIVPFLSQSSFVPIAGVANMGKNIAFNGSGAINAKIIQKLAEENNIGEIYAKLGVLNTIGSSLGMGLGLFIAMKIPDHSMRFGIIPVLTWLRIYSLKKAIKNLI